MVYVDYRRRPQSRRRTYPARPRLIIPAAVTRTLEELEEAKANGQELEQYRWCYGIPLVTDPRDFTPDPGYTTPAQMINWQVACRDWDQGRRVRFPARGDERWGIGISLLRHHDEEYPDPSVDWKT